jgi:signal transduction histidine kinase
VHDVLGQALTGLKMDLAWVASRLNSGDRKLLRRARAMSRLIDSTVQTVRKIATELRPGILDQLGLFAAIEWQVEQFEAQTGIRCSCSIDCPEWKLDNTSSIGLFRILQEILTNVIRHAKATEVKVAVGASKEKLLLEVRDDGCGIDPRQVVNPKSLGILGMRERAHILGGEITIQGEQCRGTKVLVTIPI